MTCRVVLCDDARDYVKLLKLLIDMESDMEVIGAAYDGEEAIKMCTELQPDLLVLDVSMPVMDGLTALPRIREVSPATNIVMLSGFSSDVVKQQALDLGARAFIEKGVSPLVLPGQLREQFP